jgi:hypothetical protein
MQPSTRSDAARIAPGERPRPQARPPGRIRTGLGFGSVGLPPLDLTTTVAGGEGEIRESPPLRDRSCGYLDRRAATIPTVVANRLVGLPRSSDFSPGSAPALRTLVA